MPWKLLTRLGQGDDDLLLQDEHHSPLPHLVCRPVGKAHAERFKRLMV